MSEHLDAHRAIKADSPPTESEGPMLETTRRVVAAASHIHRDLKGTADAVGTLLVDAFHLLALFLIGATTVWSAAAAFIWNGRPRSRKPGRHPPAIHLFGNRSNGRNLPRGFRYAI